MILWTHIRKTTNRTRSISYIHIYVCIFFCNAQCRQSKQHISSKHCAALSTFQFKEKVVSKIPVLVQVETIGAFAGWYYTIGAYEG